MRSPLTHVNDTPGLNLARGVLHAIFAPGDPARG